MRIAQLSDLHLGRRSPGEPYPAERLNSLRDALKTLAQDAPDVILIAGDVFDSPGVDRAIVQEAARALDQTRTTDGRRIPVILIPGNHDPSEATALWETFKGSLDRDSMLHLVLTPERVILADGKLVIDAYPCETRYSPESPWARPLAAIQPAGDAVRVVVAHGTLQGGPVPEGEMEAYPFTQADIEALAADYVALGHFHKTYPPWDQAEEIERNFCYCGTHEPDQFGIDSGTAIIATVSQGQPTRLRRHRVGRRCWRLVEIASSSALRKLDELRTEIEADGDPRRFVVRLKVSAQARLTPEEGEKVERFEGGLQALGAFVERRGEWQAVINVEALDLSALPAGALKQALLSLQEDLVQAADARQREVLAAAVQLGWEKFEK